MVTVHEFGETAREHEFSETTTCINKDNNSAGDLTYVRNAGVCNVCNSGVLLRRKLTVILHLTCRKYLPKKIRWLRAKQ